MKEKEQKLMAMITVKMEKELHKKLKIMCVLEDISLIEFAERAILKEMERYKRETGKKNNVK